MASVIDPVHPNAGIQAAYRKRLDKHIDDMDRSLKFWLTAKYRAVTPELAQDASPAMQMRELMRKLARRWQRKFDKLAPELAEWFATDATDRSDKAMQAMLRKGGFTVRFRPTRAQNDAYQAVVGENIGLIKSIASQHLLQVQGAVMRSVAAGRDLGSLTDALEKTAGITRRRAATIARDQNNKATAVMVRVRQKQLGITQAIWMHSSGGKTPRPSHLANNGKPYDVEKGWFDPDVGEYIRPGELINCRCVSRSIVPGFDA